MAKNPYPKFDAEALKERLKPNAIHQHPKSLAGKSIAGRLLKHADELTVSQQEELESGEREDALRRLSLEDRTPVSAKEWISNTYYTGGFLVWPELQKLFVELVEENYTIIVLRGAAGWGKSSIGRLLLMRTFYEVGCYANPHATIGSLSPVVPLRIPLIDIDSSNARRRLLDPMVSMIRNAGWFQDHFAPQRRVYAVGQDPPTYLAFPTLRVQPEPTNVDSVIGNDVIGCLMSECNKYDVTEGTKRIHTSGQTYDAAMEIYRELIVRLVSRFNLPHKPCVRLIMDSSERYEDDFLARVCPEIEGTGLKYKIVTHSNWETRPGANVPPFFSFAKPRKGARAEVVETKDREAKLVSDGREIIQVPEGAGKQNYQMALHYPDDFARNIVGCPTDAIERWLQDPEALERCREIRTEWLESQGKTDLEVAPESFLLGFSDVDWENLCTRDLDGNWLPRVLPHEPRYAHFDLASTGDDYVGFSMGCLAELTQGQPKAWIDLAIRFEKDGPEYNFAQLRTFIDELRKHGFYFSAITFDSFQSFDFRQQLYHRGINVEEVSVHRTTDAYVALRGGLTAGNILIDCGPILSNEFVQIEKKYVNNKEKIEHRPGGHDDVADAVAGVFWKVSQASQSVRLFAPRITRPLHANNLPVPYHGVFGPNADLPEVPEAVQAQIDAKVQAELRKMDRTKNREKRQQHKKTIGWVGITHTRKN